MTIEAVQIALNEALQAIPGLPVIRWPNVTETAETPRLEVRHFVARPQRLTIDGMHADRGFMQVTAVADLNTGMAAHSLAGQVAAGFAADQWIAFTGGRAQIEEKPNVGGGLKDGAVFRVPVSIRWRVIG